MIQERNHLIARGRMTLGKYVGKAIVLSRAVGLFAFAFVVWLTVGCSATPLRVSPISTPVASLRVSLMATPTRALRGLGLIAFVVLEGHPESAIYKMGADGASITPLTKDKGGNGHPAWSRDGQQIAFVSWRDESPGLYVMNEIGDHVRRLPVTNIIDSKLTWSPNDKQIAYSGVTDEGRSDIWIIDLENLGVTNLTRRPGLNEDPAWSPDGSQIAFGSNRDGHYQVYVMTKDGSHIRKLTDDPRGCHHPDWSPDGGRIAFACTTGRANVIHTVNADGSQDISLMSPDSFPGGSYPSWSPDGLRITFQAPSLGFNDIYVMDADGSNILRLTNLEPFSMDAREPAWQPTFR